MASRIFPRIKIVPDKSQHLSIIYRYKYLGVNKSDGGETQHADL